MIDQTNATIDATRFPTTKRIVVIDGTIATKTSMTEEMMSPIAGTTARIVEAINKTTARIDVIRYPTTEPTGSTIWTIEFPIASTAEIKSAIRSAIATCVEISGKTTAMRRDGVRRGLIVGRPGDRFRLGSHGVGTSQRVIVTAKTSI